MHCKSSVDRKIRPSDSLYGQTGVTILAPIDDFYVEFWSGLFYSWSDRTTTQGSKRRNKLGFRRNVVCLCLYYYGLLQPCLWGNIYYNVALFFWMLLRQLRKWDEGWRVLEVVAIFQPIPGFNRKHPYITWDYLTSNWHQLSLLTQCAVLLVGVSKRLPPNAAMSPHHPLRILVRLSMGNWTTFVGAFFLSICFPITRIQLYDNYDREIISCLPINSSSLTFVANRLVPCLPKSVFSSFSGTQHSSHFNESLWGNYRL